MADTVTRATLDGQCGSSQQSVHFRAFEVNEPFASIPLAWLADVGDDPKTFNPCGGAIALGTRVAAAVPA